MLFFRLPKLSPVLVSAVRSRRLTKNAPLAKELIAATTPRKWEEYQPVEVRKPAGKRIFFNTTGVCSIGAGIVIFHL